MAIRKQAKRVACIAAIAVGGINFLSFIASSARLGGDALNGYEESGRYYVAQRGETTEVSKAEWQRSRWQGLSIFMTHPLAIAGMFYLLMHDIFPKMMFRGREEDRKQKEADIRASGSPITTFSCSGKVGTLRFSGPLLSVAIYPKGIHFDPVFMPAFCVLASEIKSVSEERVLLKRCVKIVHSSPEVASPILLSSLDSQSAVSALTAIA